MLLSVRIVFLRVERLTSQAQSIDATRSIIATIAVLKKKLRRCELSSKFIHLFVEKPLPFFTLFHLWQCTENHLF